VKSGVPSSSFTPRKAFMTIGRSDERLALNDKTINLIGEERRPLHMLEALRVKGNVLLSLLQRRPEKHISHSA
jgi:hypothetical protein